MIVKNVPFNNNYEVLPSSNIFGSCFNFEIFNAMLAISKLGSDNKIITFQPYKEVGYDNLRIILVI